MNHPDTPRSQGRHAGGPTDLRPEAGAEVPSVLEQASLEQLIGRLGPMPPQRAAVVGLAVLDQLVAVHNRGMLHGDVRPGSVLLGPYDQIILTGPNLPSPAFTAPEGVTSPAADLWSLGATLYTAVEGHPPAPGGALNNAGPIAPILFGLLSGDPTQRPAPGIVRSTLLDIAHTRAEPSPLSSSVDSFPPPFAEPFTSPLAEPPPSFGEPFAPPFGERSPSPFGEPFAPPFGERSPSPLPAPPLPGPAAFPPPPRSFGSEASASAPSGPETTPPSGPEASGGFGPDTAPFNLRISGTSGPFNGDATPYGLRTSGASEPLTPQAPETSDPLGSGSAPGTSGPGGSEATASISPALHEQTSTLHNPTLLSALPSPGDSSLPDDPPSREPAPGTGTRRDIPLASPSPTGPTERSGLRTGVLVPRPIVALTGVLLVAMAVTIGILLPQTLGGADENDPAADAAAPGAKGLFAAAPRACSLLDDKQAAEVVPGFKSSEVEVSECNWLNSHDWRKPSVEKFDLRVRLVAQKQDGSELARAKEYLSGKKSDFAEKVEFTTPKPAPPKDLKGIGEGAFSFGSYNTINLYGGSYKVTVVFRVSNLVAEVEYERGGVKTDSNGRIAANAEKVARWITESLKTHG